ncbi:Mitochondrial-processing peptidase subunit alpha, partial [Blyttiomyces sp. JEL0837]
SSSLSALTSAAAAFASAQMRKCLLTPLASWPKALLRSASSSSSSPSRRSILASAPTAASHSNASTAATISSTSQTPSSVASASIQHAQSTIPHHRQYQTATPPTTTASTTTSSPPPKHPSTASSHARKNPLTDFCPTEITTLPNGLKVASQDAPGHFVTVGVYIDAGSRYEAEEFAGASHILERMAFKSTKNFSVEELMATLEKLGGNVMAHSSREAMMYHAAVFRQDLPQMVNILSEVILRPSINPQELDEVKELTSYEIGDLKWKMDAVLPEKLQQIAFGALSRHPKSSQTNRLMVSVVNDADDAYIPSGETLGRPLLCELEELDQLSTETIKKYHETWYTPDRMVLAAVGVPHEDLVKLAEKYFLVNELKPASDKVKKLQKKLSQPAKYTGGIAVIDTAGGPISPNPDDRLLTHVYIAFEAPGMSDPDVYAIATLATLMGGGGSFSAGGPGKGMYTRLYTEVLNRYHWVENCNMLSFSYLDTGLFGITASVTPSAETHQHIITILCHQLLHMTERIHPFSVELEDIGRQVLVQGTRVDVTEMCRRVDVLTADDLKRVARRIVLGEDLESPFRFDDGGNNGGFKHWVRSGEKGPTVLVHGPLTGAKDAIWDVEKQVREWGLGGKVAGGAGGSASGSKRGFWGFGGRR